MRIPTKRDILILIVVFVLYFISAQLGLVLGYANVITTVWPTAGFTLAAVLLYGYRVWPAIALGALLFSLWSGNPAITAVGIMIANTIHPLIGAFLLRKVGFDPRMSHVKDVLYLILLGGVVASVISAYAGIYSLVAGGIFHWELYGYAWKHWFIGDFLGALVVAPPILVWVSSIRAGLDIKELQIRDMLVAYAILILVSIGVYGNIIWPEIEPGASAYIIYPPLIWIALRYYQLGSVLAVLLVSIVATTCTAIRYPLETSLELEHSLFLLQRFMGITAITFLVVSALVEERERARAKQIELLKETVVLGKESSQLRKLGKAKNEFIAVASHQLRTPATVIKLRLGMLRDGVLGKLTKIQRKTVDDVYEYNDRQINMIEDLLNVAQLDMDNVVLKKKTVDMKDIVSRAITDLSPKITQRHQKIVFVHDDDEYKAKVDPDKFTAVVENLVDNASKYTPDEKKIEVKLTHNNKKTQISVKDEGVGIAKGDISKLFKKFSRIRNILSDSRGGNGLGLYWARKIAKLHGGDITVTSKPGEGSVFTVSV